MNLCCLGKALSSDATAAAAAILVSFLSQTRGAG